MFDHTMASINMSATLCAVCHKNLRNTRKAPRCAVCHQVFHLRCTLRPSCDRMINDKEWFCHLCLSDIFPFNCLTDNLEFYNCLFSFSRCDSINSYLLKNEQELTLFHAKSSPIDSDIDPDENFLNETRNSSKYFLTTEFNDFIKDRNINSSNFSILHINARSLNKNIENVSQLVNTINLKFTAIAITETWAHPDSVSSFNIRGYNCISVPRAGRPGGGVALFIDESLQYYERNDLYSYSGTAYESAFAEVKFGTKSAIVGVIYRPPDTCLSDFNNKYNNLLEKLNTEKSKHYIAGDFNINLLNYGSHNDTAAFINNASSYFQFPVITRPTRFCSTNSSLIDNIFVNNINEDYFSGLFITDISDHLPVFYISRDYANTMTETKYLEKKVRNINSDSIAKFKQKLAHESWTSTIPAADVNARYDEFLQKFKLLYEEQFPIRIKKIKIFNSQCKPWVTEAIKKSINTKDRLYKKWLKTRAVDIFNSYKKYKNKLTSIIRAAKEKYYQERFLAAQSNIKKTWSLIKSVTNGHISKSENIKEILVNNKPVNNQPQIANEINKFFVNIGTDLASKIPAVSGCYLDYLRQPSGTASFFSTPTTPQEIIDIAHNLQPNKASGCDDISPKIIKCVITEIAGALTDIFNESLLNGTFPNSMKLAKVTPIHKGDDRRLMSNYRPISVLPTFSKILEKIMHKRLLHYLEENNIITDRQFGFREKFSTSLAVTKLVDRISDELDHRKYNIGVFLDLSKAFDTINHMILLGKMEKYGIRGVANNWFRSYLEGRSQFVQLAQNQSEIRKISCGVPQGSILGPLLFILYINDVVNVSPLVEMFMFADDTNLFMSNSNVEILIQQMNAELCKLSHWFKINKLSLNIKKTNFMLFKARNKSIAHHITVQIDGTILNQVTSTKFLGVILNENLTWSDHIQLVQQKVMKSIGVICKIRTCLPRSVLRSLYFALVHPYFDYCNVIWGIERSSLFKQLIICQKKAVRIISYCKWNEHTAPLFDKLCILPVDKINDLQVGCFVYRCVNNLLSVQFTSMFMSNTLIHGYCTRQKSNLHFNYSRLNVRKNAVRIAGVSLWNSIPINIRSAETYILFKKLYKAYLYKLAK